MIWYVIILYDIWSNVIWCRMICYDILWYDINKLFARRIEFLCLSSRWIYFYLIVQHCMHVCKLLMQHVLLCNRIGHVWGLDKGYGFSMYWAPCLYVLTCGLATKSTAIHSPLLFSLDDTFVFQSPSSSPCPVLFVSCRIFILVSVFVPSPLLGSTQFLEPIVL